MDTCNLFLVFCALPGDHDSAFAEALALTADCPVPANAKRFDELTPVWWLGVVQARERRAALAASGDERLAA